MLKYAVTALAAVTLFAVTSSSVQAQNNRSWVSGTGSDANPCTRALPCASLTVAHTNTNAGGEINVLDGGAFTTGIITKSITIQNDGAGTAGVSINAGNAIIISGAGIVVTLRGLDISNVTAQNSGVVFVNGAVLHIENCTIRNFTGADAFGIRFTPNSGSSLLFVSDTVVSTNTSSTGGGILVRPTGSASVNASFTRVISKNNAVGFKSDASGTSGFINVTIDDSNATGNTQHGVWAVGGSFGTDIFIHNTMINGNTLNGLRAENAGARITTHGR